MDPRESQQGAGAAVPDPHVLDELVRRTLEAVDPRRIILFGSAARGRMGLHSDVDVLVVIPDGRDPREASGLLYRAYRGLGCAHDIVVVCESDVARYAENPYLIIHTALNQGKELYRAAF